jgi:hypothetical protein
MKKRTFVYGLGMLLSSVLWVSSVAAADNPWWQVWRAADEASGASRALFNDSERRILREYLRSQGYSGYEADERDRYEHEYKKQKKMKHLPPGLQKKLARGGQLPPGWQKKVARGEVLDLPSSALPDHWRRRLPEQPPGTSIRRVEDRVVRVLDATNVIIDVLNGN